MHHLCVCMVSLMSILSHDSCVYAYTHVDTVQTKTDHLIEQTSHINTHMHTHWKISTCSFCTTHTIIHSIQWQSQPAAHHPKSGIPILRPVSQNTRYFFSKSADRRISNAWKHWQSDDLFQSKYKCIIVRSSYSVNSPRLSSWSRSILGLGVRFN